MVTARSPPGRPRRRSVGGLPHRNRRCGRRLTCEVDAVLGTDGLLLVGAFSFRRRLVTMTFTLVAKSLRQEAMPIPKTTPRTSGVEQYRVNHYTRVQSYGQDHARVDVALTSVRNDAIHHTPRACQLTSSGARIRHPGTPTAAPVCACITSRTVVCVTSPDRVSHYRPNVTRYPVSERIGS